jgi:nicotinamidase-related amidase
MAWEAATRTACSLVVSVFVGALIVGATPAAAQQVPPAPDPVPATLNPATTALVILDVTEQTCSPQPTCTQGMVPAIAGLLARARPAGVTVIYSLPPSGSPVLPEVAPAPGDPTFVGQAQDRFYNSDLENLLRGRGISNVILVGWRENGSVLYTSVGATLRGYTVVVPEDGTSAARDYDVAIGQYQMLTQLNGNPTNEPLRPSAVTLSRTDLITLQ